MAKDPFSALARAQAKAASQKRRVLDIAAGRIIENGSEGVYVIILGQSDKYRHGPCIVPIGVLGVGASTITGTAVVTGTSTGTIDGTTTGTTDGTTIAGTTTGTASGTIDGVGDVTGDVIFTNQTEIEIGTLVLVAFPPGTSPWIVAIGPNTGPILEGTPVA